MHLWSRFILLFALFVFGVATLFMQLSPSVKAAPSFSVDYLLRNTTPEMDYLRVDTTNPGKVSFTLDNATHLWMHVSTKVQGASVVPTYPQGDLRGYYAKLGLILPTTIYPTQEEYIGGTKYSVAYYDATFSAADQSVQMQATPYNPLAFKLTTYMTFADLVSKISGVDITSLVFQVVAGHNPLAMLDAFSKIHDLFQFATDFRLLVTTGQGQYAINCVNDLIKLGNDASEVKALQKLFLLGLGTAIGNTVIGALLKVGALILNVQDYVAWFFDYVKPFNRFLPTQQATLLLTSHTVVPPPPTPTPTTPSGGGGIAVVFGASYATYTYQGFTQSNTIYLVTSATVTNQSSGLVSLTIGQSFATQINGDPQLRALGALAFDHAYTLQAGGSVQLTYVGWAPTANPNDCGQTYQVIAFNTTSGTYGPIQC